MKFLLWNLENFFISPHIKSSFNQPLKNQKKVDHIINLLDELAPEIMFFCEMGGEDSALKLEQKLKENYSVFYTEGNSDRGIGLSFFLHKKFGHYSFHTHTDRILPPITVDDRYNPRKFSRDIAELRILDHEAKPRLILWGAHLKSGQDRSGNDWRGIRQRSAEVRGLVTLLKERRAQFPHATQWLTGDFNGQIYGPKPDTEFEHLLVQLPDMADILEILEVPASERWSFVMNTPQGMNPIQLDYLFLPRNGPAPLVSDSGFMQLWQRLGINAGIPVNAQAKDAWPSDHLPLLASWDQTPF